MNYKKYAYFGLALLVSLNILNAGATENQMKELVDKYTLFYSAMLNEPTPELLSSTTTFNQQEYHSQMAEAGLPDTAEHFKNVFVKGNIINVYPAPDKVRWVKRYNTKNGQWAALYGVYEGQVYNIIFINLNGQYKISGVEYTSDKLSFGGGSFDFSSDPDMESSSEITKQAMDVQ